MTVPFNFELPVGVFEKADAEPGKQRRIGGIATTERPDEVDETVIQRSLDWSPFLSGGWFNDNHSPKTADILGYPEEVKFFKAGAELPDGQTAPGAGHWVEGYLLETPEAEKIWTLGKALAKTKRRLGFSIEGNILKRNGPLRKTIARAVVRNIAITNAPINRDARLEVLARSIAAFETNPDSMQVEEALETIRKALTMGTGAGVLTHPAGPQTGENAGQVLAPESLLSDLMPREFIDEEEDEEAKAERARKAFSDGKAVAFVLARLPHATSTQAARIVELTKARLVRAA